MATAGLLSLLLTWWASPIDRAAGLTAGHGGTLRLSLNRLAPVLFAARGIAPIGYAAFAFALGVTFGVLIRRTIPAMASTLAVFAGVQIAMPLWVRPHLIAPLRATPALNPAAIGSLMLMHNGSQLTVTAAVNIPGAWVISNQTINAAGHVFTGPPTQACLSHTGPRACAASLAKLDLRQLVTYEPASRYWAFQRYETAIFLALAVALDNGFCFWRIRRRLS